MGGQATCKSENGEQAKSARLPRQLRSTRQKEGVREETADPAREGSRVVVCGSAVNPQAAKCRQGTPRPWSIRSAPGSEGELVTGEWANARLVFIGGEAEIWEKGMTNTMGNVAATGVLMWLITGFGMALNTYSVCGLLNDPMELSCKYFCHIFGICSLMCSKMFPELLLCPRCAVLKIKPHILVRGILLLNCHSVAIYKKYMYFANIHSSWLTAPQIIGISWTIRATRLTQQWWDSLSNDGIHLATMGLTQQWWDLLSNDGTYSAMMGLTQQWWDSLSNEDWCWSWSSNTLATWWKELTHWKRPWCWEGLGQEEKGTT